MRRTPDQDAIESRLIVCQRGDLHQFRFDFLSFSRLRVHSGFSIGAPRVCIYAV